MSKVEIITDGKTISGWNSVNIKRSMTELCHSFELSFSNKWVDEFPPIYAGAKCIIKIDDVKILTGYIDNIITNITSNNIEYNISGRSKTEDLVDCNRIKSPFTWNNKDIKYLAEEICKPYGIGVVVDTKNIGKKFATATIDNNEKDFNFLQKLARQRNLLTLTNSDGDLVLTNASNIEIDDSFVYGKNISDISGRFSLSQLYSNYIVKGQAKIQKNKESWTDKTIAVYSKAQDENVDRYRPIMFTGDTQISIHDAQNKVNWEAQVRAGRVTKFTIKNPSWYQDSIGLENGKLWKENLLVYVNCDLMKLDGRFIVESVEYELKNNEQNIVLNFVLPEAYAVEPVSKRKKKTKEVGKYGWVK